MTETEFLDLEILQIPIERKEEDFSDFTRTYLQNYLGSLRQISDTPQLQDRVKTIENFCNHLIKSVEEYYVGRVQPAYQLFCDGMELVEKYLWLDTPDVTVYHDENTEAQLREHFFKARVFHTGPCEKKDLFIRPFEQREFVHTYRYSIPGLPCLYLSSNIYTAWNELDRPDINNLQVSMFVLDKTLKRLRFGFSINFWKHGIKTNREEYAEKLFDYLTYFPVHAMCNVRVKNPTAIFKPEYIFPQFLMQWVKDKHRIDMVEYNSTKIIPAKDGLSFAAYNCRNLAIPAQSLQSKGICSQLQMTVKLTDPLSWQQLLTAYPNAQFPSKEKAKGNFFSLMRDMIEIEIISGKPISYRETIFGKMENYMIDEMEPTRIK